MIDILLWIPVLIITGFLFSIGFFISWELMEKLYNRLGL